MGECIRLGPGLPLRSEWEKPGFGVPRGVRPRTPQDSSSPAQNTAKTGQRAHRKDGSCGMSSIEAITIREMTDCAHDYSLLEKWLNNPSVLEYYEGCDRPYTRDMVVAKFRPRVLKLSSTVPCIIQRGDAEIGYIQYTRLAQEDKVGFGFDTVEEIFGMDIFIGETHLWDKGIGSIAVALMLKTLREDQHADRVIIDPHVDNSRAIRCYEKCGFRKLQVLHNYELHEGAYRDCWLMATRTPAVLPNDSDQSER